ncbi:DUF2637 domain-containing protein [Actinomadura sp. KC345]|uniref:DUF2637 domain-containing protein n=1 Tax=Actinomadura sp. KC345 TaxID=2530371 RepID=UPI002441F581|nr:DUF2637 domain-containing protein [Actinomadura sp. KC345]
MYQLVLRYGETSWTAALLPVSVDGMIAVVSMSLLVDSRQGRRSGILPWTLLVLGSTASLAANVAVAEPSVVGRLIAAWPSCALIGAYELLMRQIRHTAVEGLVEHDSTDPRATSERAHRVHEPVPGVSAPTGSSPENSHQDLRLNMAFSGERVRKSASRPRSSGKSRRNRSIELMRSSEPSQEPNGDDRARARHSSLVEGTGDVDIQQRAWCWAVANRTPEGDLPPGKVIGGQFGRSERWGRLVKQAGRAGRLDAVAS